MRAFAFLCVALALAVPEASARSREIRKRITTVEKQLEQMRDARELIRKSAPTATRDWRGRTKLDDINQWAYTREVDERVAALLDNARAVDDAQAQTALDEASRLLDDASARALEIAGYWQTPAVSSRTRWQLFAVANGLAAEPADAHWLAAEDKVRGYLSTGDFIRAASASVHIEAALQTAFRDATGELVKARGPADLKFIPRKTPCPGADGTASKAGISRAVSPDAYYPPGSKRRQEQGAIVVRAHIAATNCGTEFAIVVSSGYPELDEAALEVAEGNTYVAANENGAPIDGYLTFKVRFTFAP